MVTFFEAESVMICVKGQFVSIEKKQGYGLLSRTVGDGSYLAGDLIEVRRPFTVGRTIPWVGVS